jgi:hypothetical protein
MESRGIAFHLASSEVFFILLMILEGKRRNFRHPLAGTTGRIREFSLGEMIQGMGEITQG